MSRKYNKTFTSLKTVVHDTSILDAQKILVKPFNGQTDERTDIMELIHSMEYENAINSDRLEVVEKEVLGVYIPHNFTTNSTGASNETEGTAIQISKAHFVNGGVQIQSLQLPYTLAVGITDQYCHIQFCDTNNEIIKTVVSKNTQSQVSGDTGISVWDFEKDAIVPEDYHVARIILSGIKETSEFGTTTVFRINVVNNNGVEFDTDECCIWYGAETSYNYLGDVSLTYGIHTGTLKSQLNEDISEINDDIDEVNDKVSLLEEFKNNANEKIENIEEKIISIEDILDGEFVDKTFTTATTGDTAETAGRGIQLSKTHFIEGGTILKSISLPYKGADYTRNNQYCHVTFYNESEQPIKKITSADTQSRAYDTNGVSKWTFIENNTLPDDYYYAQIALSGSATDNPNIKTGSQCSTYTINVIRKNGNNVTFDEDICQCYGVNGAVMNYLGDVTVEYQGPGPTLAEIVVDNSNRITILEEKTPEGVAKVNEANTFTATNTFNGSTVFNGSSRFQTGPYDITINERGLWSYYPVTSDMGFVTEGALSVAPLGVTTALGADAYALKVSKTEGIQLWGTHFMQGDEWSDKALKIVHNELALFGNHQAPCSLTFDNANVVNFRVMPDDGSTANGGQGAIFDFQGWQWDNDNHTSKNANCPVQILKNNAGELVDRSLLNKSEIDARYAQLHSENTLTETNTFEKTLIAEDGMNVTSGDIVISEGVITFEDLVDGTVIERSGASGYQYVEGMPTSFENGVCYDIGEISNTTNLTNVKFTGEGRLVQTCELWFKTPATVPTTHLWPANIYWIDSATGAAPTLLASKNYRIVFRQEPKKIIASIAYLY